MASAPDRDRGGGLIGALTGLIVVLALALFAVQLLVNLYATAVVTEAAFDAARLVATSGDPTDASTRAEAEARARAHLGRYGDGVDFDWEIDADVVRLRVRAVNPRFLLPILGGRLGFDVVDRTVGVRVERRR